MKQDFYGLFYDKTKNEFVSIWSRILYLFYILKFIFQDVMTRNKIVCCDNAIEVVSKVYPKPNYIVEAYSMLVDNSINVSIIIPVYNYRDLISDCFDSVLKRHKKYNFELILIDDGSTDGAAKICDSYAEKDSRVVVTHKENGGIGSARNTGINNARGKYIMFVDCDDYVHDNFV